MMWSRVQALRLKGVRGSIAVVQAFPESLAGRAFRVRGSSSLTGNSLLGALTRTVGQAESPRARRRAARSEAAVPPEQLAGRARRRERERTVTAKKRHRRRDGDDFDDMPAPGDAAKLGVGMRVTPEPARAPGWLARRLPVALRRPGSWQHDADA